MKKLLLTTLKLSILSVLLTSCPDPNDDDPVYFEPELEVDNESTTFLDGALFTSGIEGPAVDRNDNLYAVNYGSQGTIGKVTLDGSSSTFLTLPEGSAGNSIRFYNSDMYIADYTGHKIYKVSEDSDTEIYAEDATMNQPNDLTIAKNGQIFCSDPNWSSESGRIWTVSPDDQKLVEIKSNLGTTNGIELSPDDQFLYVNESNSLQILRYKIDWNTSPVSLKEELVFYSFSDGGVDGMRCDQAGNLFVARITSQEVAIISPFRELLKSVKLIGKNPTNVAFGGEDGKTVYVTMKDTKNIEQFRTSIEGRSIFIR